MRRCLLVLTECRQRQLRGSDSAVTEELVDGLVETVKVLVHSLSFCIQFWLQLGDSPVLCEAKLQLRVLVH